MTTLKTGLGGLSAIQIGFGRKKVLKATFGFSLNTIVFFFSNPNFVNKTSGTSDSKTSQIVILTVTNIGGITRGIL